MSSHEEFVYNPGGTIRYIKRAPVSSSRQTADTSGSSSSATRHHEDTSHHRSDRDRKRLEPREAPPPWSWAMDRQFFQPTEAAIRRYTPEYYEFQEFYRRFLAHRETKPHPASQKQDESALIEEALVHFETFKQRKLETIRVKVQTQRRELPVYQFRERVIDTVRSNQVTIIAADTGAGKSTQVPQFLMEAGFENIACTQPRRIACISLAKRVSYETMNIYGSQIAYQIRFEGTRTETTKVLFLTEGVLLRQFSSDPQLTQYDCIVIDEVHERHAMGDFLLGILKRVLRDRPTLKLVLMSATINSNLFSKYFNNAPLIEVPGRLFPVDIRYIPCAEEIDMNVVDPRLVEERKKAEFKRSIPAKSLGNDAKPIIQLLESIDEKFSPTERGDMLIFVPGINEITALANQISEYAGTNGRWIVLKLHSSLPIAEQDRVFDLAPEGVRKCIISTNIAETSVTIDGIRFVVDTGRVRELDYDIGSNLSKLSEFWISKASGKQRAGRAGRTGPGICYRLYTEEEFENLNDFSIPEIMRCSLDQMVLQMKALDLGDPKRFDFVERPPPESLDHAIQLLQNVGALDSHERLTLLGHTLSHLPVDVILGKMLILGAVFDLIELVILVAAGLSVQSPLMNLNDLKSEVTQNRRKLDSPHGDPFTLLNVYQEWVRVKADRREPSRKWCDRYGIQEQRLYEMSKLVSQFRSILETHLGVASKDEKRGTLNKGVLFGRLQKRKHEHMSSFRKTKVLKMHEDKAPSLEDQVYNVEEEELEDELPSLEFEYRTDLDSYNKKLQRLKLDRLSLPQLAILKLIVCSGLYPNLALPDEGNKSRRLQDQVYHTLRKRFVLVHPSSVFATNPDFVNAKKTNRKVDSTTLIQSDFLAEAAEGNVDIVNADAIYEKNFRQPADLDRENSARNLQLNSQTPEFLSYLQILETNKPYLLNLLRVPSLQTTLLFGKCIDTNTDLSMLVVDEWITLHFKYKNRYSGVESKVIKHGSPITFAVLKLIQMVFELRSMWTRLVGRKLAENKEVGSIGLRFPGGITGVDLELEDETYYSHDLLQKLPPPLMWIFRESRESGITSSIDELKALRESDDTEQRFKALLERFLSVDVMLDGLEVHYEVDTLRAEDLGVIFPDPKSFGVPVPQFASDSQKRDRIKCGIRLSNYLNYATVHYPSSIFKSNETAQVGTLITGEGISNPSVAPAPAIGLRQNTRKVWVCHVCKYSSMMTQDEVEEHRASKCPGPPKSVKHTPIGVRYPGRENDDEQQQSGSQMPPLQDPSVFYQQFGTSIISGGTTNNLPDSRKPMLPTLPAASLAYSSKTFQCPVCKKLFPQMTPVEILKHKRTCK